MSNHHTRTVKRDGDELKIFPSGGDITCGCGHHGIVFDKGEGTDFNFYSIEFSDDRPFHTSLGPDRIIVVNENDNISGMDRLYKYVIYALDRDGNRVASEDPRIINKGR